ncbi:MAG TPA: rod shape-determining protein RodA, partial [Flavobacteriales bacterium]|nr:rod shape-determining protein RodA [Flavobacteriales bacterium]
NLEDGQIVTSPLTVEFGVEGMVVEPAGEVKENSGHHHLLIDHDFSRAGTVVPPADSTQLHFGKGQLSTEINLAPGDHKLTMQFANGVHMSYGEKMSATITVSVEAAAKHMDE